MTDAEASPPRLPEPNAPRSAASTLREIIAYTDKRLRGLQEQIAEAQHILDAAQFADDAEASGG